MTRKPLQDIERSIQTTYRKYIWSTFIKAISSAHINEYPLFATVLGFCLKILLATC